MISLPTVGTTECPHCGGGGLIKCYSCNGKRIVDCGYCSDGRVMCKDCWGNGYRNVPTNESGKRDKVPGGQVSGIICIINMHLSHIFDKGELGSFDNRKLTTPLQSHCCFYMYKTAYS